MRADAFVLFPDPECLESERRTSRDNGRRRQARLHGYLPPPREKHCPPKPSNGLCERCGKFTKGPYLDHCHKTGAFRGWVCNSCNTGQGIMDGVERLEKRVAFLKERDKKIMRIALIKETHQRLRLVGFAADSCYNYGKIERITFLSRSRSGSGSTPPTALLSRK